MHMADALLSAEVGAAMWAVSAGTIACCSARLGREADDRKVPLMGVLGAFLFAAQMINFAIPGTGSSGHLSGGLLLAILLGPSAALLTIASVLVVQALFFADGGLLALGCNIFNLGVIPALVVYPFFHRNLAGGEPTPRRLAVATMISAVLALQLGPLAVVLETICSGMASLPFATFALLMQPIHLAIGLVEGAVTVAVVSFVLKARPDIVRPLRESAGVRRSPVKILIAFLACALLTAALLSGFASKDPDGLEWSIAKATGKAELSPVQQGVHGALAALQGITAWFPDYDLWKPTDPGAAFTSGPAQQPSGNFGTSIAGVAGSLLTLLFACALGLLLKRRHL